MLKQKKGIKPNKPKVPRRPGGTPQHPAPPAAAATARLTADSQSQISASSTQQQFPVVISTSEAAPPEASSIQERASAPIPRTHLSGVKSTTVESSSALEKNSLPSPPPTQPPSISNSTAVESAPLSQSIEGTSVADTTSTTALLLQDPVFTTSEQHDRASPGLFVPNETSPTAIRQNVEGREGRNDGVAADEVDLSSMGAGAATDISQLVPQVSLNADGTSGTMTTPVTGRKKKPTQRKKLVNSTSRRDDSNEREVGQSSAAESAPIPDELRPKPKRKRKVNNENATPRKRKKRADTPEDAEEQEIDHQTVKMAELCKDIRIGRKFSRHAEIKQREIDKKLKAKFAKEHPELAAIEEARTAEAAAAEAEALAVMPAAGPQMRVVNGQIVLDDRTMMMDRHAQPGLENGIMEVVEENEFSRMVNSGTLQKKEKAMRWDELALSRFYEGLRMFGTDFEMIAQLFPDRSRRLIKLKFNKEEREYPDRITAALLGSKIEVDFAEFQENAGVELETTAAIEAEYAKIEAANQAEQDAILKSAADNTKKKQNEIRGIIDDADGEAGGAASGAAETGGVQEPGKASAASRKKKASKKKNMHSSYGGGEDAEVVGDA